MAVGANEISWGSWLKFVINEVMLQSIAVGFLVLPSGFAAPAPSASTVRKSQVDQPNESVPEVKGIDPRSLQPAQVGGQGPRTSSSIAVGVQFPIEGKRGRRKDTRTVSGPDAPVPLRDHK